MSEHSAENDAPYQDGYDWLLNTCGDLERAAHAGHLDEAERDPECFYCKTGEGWTRPIPPE